MSENTPMESSRRGAEGAEKKGYVVKLDGVPIKFVRCSCGRLQSVRGGELKNATRFDWLEQIASVFQEAKIEPDKVNLSIIVA